MQTTNSFKRKNFNNPAVVTQSWYVAAPSRQVGRNQVKSFDLLNRRIALYRDAAGVAHTLDARCAHLGADLGLGQVIGQQLQCPFHHWRYEPDGKCCYAPDLTEVPKRKVRAYPTLERWGLIWIFNGPKPLFDLPEAPTEERCWHLRLPPQHINCHPHLVIANGLDITHFEALHDMQYTSPPCLTMQTPYRITVEVQGKPRSRWLQMLTGSRHHDIKATFTTIGGNLAWVTVLEPLRFHALFAGRPSAKGGCDTQVILLFPTGTGVRFLRALALMYVLLHDDHRVLDTLFFRPGFTAADIALKTFVQTVNRMEIW